LSGKGVEVIPTEKRFPKHTAQFIQTPFFRLMRRRTTAAPFGEFAASHPAQQRGDYSMKKILLASVIALAPFAAFAVDPNHGTTTTSGAVVGDINDATTSSSSNAGVGSRQGTGAGVSVGGNGGVSAGAVSGNSSQVKTTASGTASPGSSATKTTAAQSNIGGTVASGEASNRKWGPQSTGSAGGSQSSTTSGGSSATAGDTNVGGFVAGTSTQHKGP
jgi:hypothetical protein